MTQRGQRLVIAVGLIAVLHSAAAWSQQWLNLEPLDWQLVLEFDGVLRDTEGLGESNQEEFREGLRLIQRGYSLDPRIASFAIELRPRFTQRAFTGPSGDQDAETEFLNYAFNASLLHGTQLPWAVSAQLSNDSGTSSGSFGSRTDFDSTLGGFTVNHRYEPFRSTFQYNERLLDQTFRSTFTSQSIRRNERQRSFRYSGHSSKTRVGWTHTDLDDRIASGDFAANRLNVDHSFGWGKGSNLNSSLFYTDRSGRSDSQSLNLTEFV